MSKRKFLRRTAPLTLVAPIALLFACNAILGAGDYKVGDGTDGGSDQPPGQEDGGAGNMGSGGRSATGGATGKGGKAAGSGGATFPGGGPGSGGKAAGSGGATFPGGGPGSGGRGSGGATNPGGGPTFGGAGGATGSLTVADFVGEWDTDAETLSTECSDGEPPTNELTADTIEWTSGSAGTIETIFGPCTIVARISGRVATIVPAPPCDDAGISYSFAGTFTILPNGTASLNQRVIASMPPVSCTLTATGVFTKYVPGT